MFWGLKKQTTNYYLLEWLLFVTMSYCLMQYYTFAEQTFFCSFFLDVNCSASCLKCTGVTYWNAMEAERSNDLNDSSVIV